MPTDSSDDPQSLLRWTADAYRRGDLAAARLACDRLLNLQDAPDWARSQALHNGVVLAAPLAEQAAGLRTSPLALVPEGWVPAGPPVLMADNSGLHAVAAVRGQTGQHLLGRRLAPDLTPGSEVLVIDGLPADLAAGPFTVAPSPDGDWTALTHRDREPIRLFGKGTATPVEIAIPNSLPRPPRGSRCWLPALRDGRVTLVSPTCDTLAMTLDDPAGSPVAHPAPRLAERWRGGTGLVPFGDAWLAVVREDEPQDVALHRFVAFDEAWRIIALSHPFQIADPHGETVSGLWVGRYAAILAWADRTGQAWLTQMPAAEIARLLHPVDALMPTGPHDWSLPPVWGFYLDALTALHRTLEPATYLEIGVHSGRSLALANCEAVGVDPDPVTPEDFAERHPLTRIVPTTSDDFFARHSRRDVFGDRRVDLAFIDGLHLSEQVVRDFANIEKWSSPETVVVFHDVLPMTLQEARREEQPDSWTGDVWKVVPFLQQHRPDLQLHLLSREDAPFTGLLVVTGLDPDNRVIDSLPAEAFEWLEREDNGSTLRAYLATARTTPLPELLAKLRARREQVVPAQD